MCIRDRATQDQIEEGPAYILTTIDGDKVEKFEINISKVNRQREADSKGLEIEVTDKRLLAYCGGIVQGMSGSPIIPVSYTHLDVYKRQLRLCAQIIPTPQERRAYTAYRLRS